MFETYGGSGAKAAAGGGAIGLAVLLRLGLGMAKVAAHQSSASSAAYEPPPMHYPSQAAQADLAPRWTPPAAMVAAAPLDLAAAQKAARVKGAKPGKADPDLSGSWVQQQSDEGLSSLMRIRRTRKAPGVYEIHTTTTMTQDGTAILRLETTGIEVVSPDEQCQYANEVDVSYADPELAAALGEMAKDLGPDRLNEQACSPLASLTASRIVGQGEAGFVETRSE